MVHSNFHIISNKKTATPEMKEGGNNFLYPARYIFGLILLSFTISSRAINMDSLSMKNYIPSSTTTATYVAKDKMDSQDKYKQTRYWKKHKRLKACGWTTLGIGVPTMVVGFVGAVASGYESGGDGEGFGIVICAGAGLTVSSIPLFVFAESYCNCTWHRTRPTIMEKAQTVQNWCMHSIGHRTCRNGNRPDGRSF